MNKVHLCVWSLHDNVQVQYLLSKKALNDFFNIIC